MESDASSVGQKPSAAVTEMETPPTSGPDGGGDADTSTPGEKESTSAEKPVLVSLDYMGLGEDSRESTGFSEVSETHPSMKSLVSADYGEDSSGSSGSPGAQPDSRKTPPSVPIPGSTSAGSAHLESGDRNNDVVAEHPVKAAEESLEVTDQQPTSQMNQPDQASGVTELQRQSDPPNVEGSLISCSITPAVSETEKSAETAFADKTFNDAKSITPQQPQADLAEKTVPAAAAVVEQVSADADSELVRYGAKEACVTESDGTCGHMAADAVADIPLPPTAAQVSAKKDDHEQGLPADRLLEAECLPHPGPSLPPEAEGLPPRVVSILLQGQEHHTSPETPSQPAPCDTLKRRHDDDSFEQVEATRVEVPASGQSMELHREDPIEEIKELASAEKNEEEPMDWDETSVEADRKEGAVILETRNERDQRASFEFEAGDDFDLLSDSDSQPSKMETAEARITEPPYQPGEGTSENVEDADSLKHGQEFLPGRDDSNIVPGEEKTPEESVDVTPAEEAAVVPPGENVHMELSAICQREGSNWSRSDVAQMSANAHFENTEESQGSADSQGFHHTEKTDEVHFPKIVIPLEESESEAVLSADVRSAAPAHDFGADIRAAIHPSAAKLQEEDSIPNNPSSGQFLEDDSMAAVSLAPDEESMQAGDSSMCPDEESRVTLDSNGLYPGEDSVAGEESMSLGGVQGELPRKRKLTFDSVLGVDEESQAAEDVHFPGLTPVAETGADAPSSPKCPRLDDANDSVQLQDQALDQEQEVHEGLPVFLPENLYEYQWPQDGGEWHMLQEQISEYLGILSFKRKYPDLSRRTVEKLEKEFLREKGAVSETQCDLGLTALRSEEVYDLMHKDYPEKYQEYAAVLHERQKQTIKEQHKEYEVPKLEKSKMAAYLKKAAKSAAEFNLQLQRERKEERRAYFDLQTFTVQFPRGRYKVMSPEKTNAGPFPVTLLPGQYQNYCAFYTSDELRYLPLNTVMYDPPKRMQNKLANPAVTVTAESSEDADSAEDKNGSASDGDSDGSGSSDSEDSGPETENDAEEQKGEETKAEDTSCRVCNEATKKGKDGKIEELVKCSECNTYGHPTCLDLPKKMVEIITTYPWQCMECKTCVECMDPYDEDKMMFCDRCDRGYHTFCVGLRSIPTGRWECKSCKGTCAGGGTRSRSSSRRSRH